MSEEKTNNNIIHETELSRDLSLYHVTMIGVGAMIGAGIFVLTGIAAGHAGPALIIAFGLNGLVTLFTAFSYAELGSAFPEAGGGYLWVKHGLGGINGFQAGWMSWFAHAVACSLYILGFGYYFWEAMRFLKVNTIINPIISSIAPGAANHEDLIQKFLAVLIAILFGYINFKGASETGKWGSFITILKVLILALFIISGFFVIIKNPEWTSKYKPFLPQGLGGVLGAMGLTYIAFEGYEIIVQSGEEIKEPGKNLPKAVFYSLFIVVPIYMLVGFVALGAVEIPEAFKAAHPAVTRVWDYLAISKEGAMVESAKQFMILGYPLMILGGLFATMSALNATIYSSSRVSFAMGRDRNLPDIFAKVHKKKRTPHMAVFLSVILIIIMALSLPIEDVAASADIMFILLFLQVNVALLSLRKKRSKAKRPFKVPFIPYMPIIAIVLQLILGVYLFHLSPIAWYATIIWLVAGTAIYFGYAKGRERERAEEKIVYEEKLPTESEYRILVPVAHPKHVKNLISVAASISKKRKGDILAMGVVKVPEQLPVKEGRRYIKDFKSILNKAVKIGQQKGVVVQTLIRIGHDVGTAILDTVKDREIDLMIMGWKGFSTTKGSVFGGILDKVVMNAECDVLTMRMFKGTKLKKVLIPTSGGPHACFALELIRPIAKEFESNIKVIMIAPYDSTEQEKKNYQRRIDYAVDFLKQEITNVEGELISSRTITKGILKEAENYDTCVLGAAREGTLQQIVFGSIPERIAKKTSKSVIMVKKYQSTIDNIISRLLKKAPERVGKR